MSKVETLGQALDAAAHETEPDVAAAVHGGVERGRRKRRTRRLAQVAGSTAGIVAVGAAGIFIAEGSPKQHAVTPTPATTATTAGPAKPAPARTSPRYAPMATSDKVLDIRMHLPALLQQLLPSGKTIAAPPKDWTAFGGAAFRVSDATGASQVRVTSGPVEYDDPTTMTMEFCPGIGPKPPKSCDKPKVPGGTLFILNEDETAAEEYGGRVPDGILQPGHENDIVWRQLRMTFVPDDHNQPYFQIDERTQVEAKPYAGSPPKGSELYQWPPTNSDLKEAVGTQLTISTEDFAAMIGKPQLGQIQHLLDTAVPASQSAIAQRDAVNAQLARLAGPVLPAGVKITVDYSEVTGGMLVLTGPTGVNGLQWYTDKRSHGLLDTNNLKCAPADGHCETKKVPGATVQWNNGFEDPQPKFSHFEYVPDDPGGKEVAIVLSPGDPGAMPDPTTPKKSTVQLTYDQMLAIVTSPNIADIMNQTTLLGK